jgi:hypothetical protein
MMRLAVPSALLALGAALAVSADDCGGGVTWCASYAPSGGETFSVQTTVQGQASPPNPVTPDGPLPEELTLFASTMDNATSPLSFAFQLAAADGSSPHGWFVCTIEPVPEEDGVLDDDDEAKAYCQQTFQAADDTTIVYNLVLDLEDDDDNGSSHQCNVKAVAAVGMALPANPDAVLDLGDVRRGPYTWWVKTCSGADDHDSDDDGADDDDGGGATDDGADDDDGGGATDDGADDDDGGGATDDGANDDDGGGANDPAPAPGPAPASPFAP